MTIKTKAMQGTSNSKHDDCKYNENGGDYDYDCEQNCGDYDDREVYCDEELGDGYVNENEDDNNADMNDREVDGDEKAELAYTCFISKHDGL